jgi:adenosine/AMP kinase
MKMKSLVAKNCKKISATIPLPSFIIFLTGKFDVNLESLVKILWDILNI